MVPVLRHITDREFLLNISNSPWLLCPGMTAKRVWPDYLHVVDLALAPDAAASAARQPIAGQFKVIMTDIPGLHMLLEQALLELTRDASHWQGLDPVIYRYRLYRFNLRQFGFRV